jgi:hypothetical protein
MAGEPGDLDRALDSLIERFGQGVHQGEVIRAKSEYQERTGKVFEDDPIYEERTVSFLEWYVLDRPLDEAGIPPVVLALRDAAAPGAAEHTQAWRALARSHLSLFEVLELEEGRVLLADLVGGARFAVAERRRFHGVASGDLVTARLIGYAGDVRFGRTFSYHPAGARAAILGHVHRIRAAGGTRADAVDYVMSLRVRCERYKHVAQERVYEAATSEFPTAGSERDR